MFIVIKSEHYDCTNLICKKDTLEEAVAAVKDSMAQRINKNYHHRHLDVCCACRFSQLTAPQE